MECLVEFVPFPWIPWCYGVLLAWSWSVAYFNSQRILFQWLTKAISVRTGGCSSENSFLLHFFFCIFSLILATFMYLLPSNHQISETERYSVYHVFRNIKLEMNMKKFGIWAVAAALFLSLIHISSFVKWCFMLIFLLSFWY